MMAPDQTNKGCYILYQFTVNQLLEVEYLLHCLGQTFVDVYPEEAPQCSPILLNRTTWYLL